MLTRLAYYVLIYWVVSGRAGWVGIWLEVCVSWPRAKYFPVQLNLTQSIRILSYDHCVWIFVTEQTRINQYAFLAVPSAELFFGYGFPTKLHTGPFGSHDKNLYTFFSSLLYELSGFYFYVLTGAYLLVTLLLLLLLCYFLSFLVSSALLWHDRVLLVPCSFYRNNKKVRSIKSS